MNSILKVFRRVFIMLIGLTLLLIGVVLLVTPGPGILVILVGLSILATEFAWARITLKKVKDQTYDTSRGLYQRLCDPRMPGWVRWLCGLAKNPRPPEP
jgi:uncharacterized protein (TIGR02611 family)